jgi:hypothetical protein
MRLNNIRRKHFIPIFTQKQILVRITPDPRAKNPVIKESAETPAQETTDATAQEKVQISNQEVK